MQMQAEPTTPQGLALARPRVVLWIVLWIGIAIALTTQRLMVVTFLPTLEMFDGVNPDAWFAPWISDPVLGSSHPSWLTSPSRRPVPKSRGHRCVQIPLRLQLRPRPRHAIRHPARLSRPQRRTRRPGNADRLKQIAMDLKKARGIETPVAAADLGQENFLAPHTDGLDVGLLVSNARSPSMGAFLRVPTDDLITELRLKTTAHLELAHYFGDGVRFDDRQTHSSRTVDVTL